ncbi:MAG: recombinase family protein [Fusobacteriaceae bacterium]
MLNINLQTNVSAYVRYSSDNQRDESLEAQLRAIEEYCKSNSYNLVQVYSDRAKSATTDKRPGFQKMIADSAHGLFNFVIVHKLDRFSRDKYDSAKYKRKLKDNGVRVISVTERLDDSPESIILESVIEGMSEYYSKNLAREVMKGLSENAYQCKHTGGKPPLGYDVTENKKYIINEKESEAVKLIFQMYVDNYTSGDMIRKLNELGFRTKIGNVWNKNSISSIVRNEKYSGVYIYNRSAKKNSKGMRNNHQNKDEADIIRIEGGMPVIIEKELFNTVQQKLKERKNSGTVIAKTTYLLAGIVKCECGSSMHGNRRSPKRKNKDSIKVKPEYVSYRCGCRKNKSTEVCNNPEIRKEYLEEYVLRELEKNILNEALVEELAQKTSEYLKEEEKNVERIKYTFEKEIKEIDTKIANIINAVSMGFATIELKNALDSYNLQKQEIQSGMINLTLNEKLEKTVSVEEIKIHLKNIKSFILERNHPEIKKFIKDFVKEIVVTKKGIEVTFCPLFHFVKYSSEFQIYSEVARLDLYEPLKRSMSLKLHKKKEVI